MWPGRVDFLPIPPILSNYPPFSLALLLTQSTEHVRQGTITSANQLASPSECEITGCYRHGCDARWRDSHSMTWHGRAERGTTGHSNGCRCLKLSSAQLSQFYLPGWPGDHSNVLPHRYIISNLKQCWNPFARELYHPQSFTGTLKLNFNLNLNHINQLVIPKFNHIAGLIPEQIFACFFSCGRALVLLSGC